MLWQELCIPFYLPGVRSIHPINFMQIDDFYKAGKKKLSDGHYFWRVIINSKKYIFSTIVDVLFHLFHSRYIVRQPKEIQWPLDSILTAPLKNLFSIYPLFSVQRHFAFCIIYGNVKYFKVFNSVEPYVLIPVQFLKIYKVSVSAILSKKPMSTNINAFTISICMYIFFFCITPYLQSDFWVIKNIQIVYMASHF